MEARTNTQSDVSMIRKLVLHNRKALQATARRREEIAFPDAQQHSLNTGFAHCGRVTACDDECCRLEDGVQARVALSCLVKPQPGDLVQVFRTDHQCFITAILRRPALEQPGHAECKLELTAGAAGTLLVSVKNLQLVASDSMMLCAGNACDIASPAGAVTLTAKNLFTIATDNLIQQARTSFTQVLNYSVKALELLHLKGKHQLISAEKEIRLDGQFINMG